METNIKDSTKMENFMAKESIYGWMDHAMKVNLKKAWGMDKAVGNLPSSMETYI